MRRSPRNPRQCRSDRGRERWRRGAYDAKDSWADVSPGGCQLDDAVVKGRDGPLQRDGDRRHYGPPMRERQADRRLWTWVVVLGLTGQLAWTVENMYLNVFVYDTITDSPDRVGQSRRRERVRGDRRDAARRSGLRPRGSTARVHRRRVRAVGRVHRRVRPRRASRRPRRCFRCSTPSWSPSSPIILLDCVMSVLGAAANDAAFNAWVTDSTDPGNRGRVDGVLATMPLLAMLLVFGALDPLTRGGHWDLFFSLVGGVTAVVGVIAWFGLRRDPHPATWGHLPLVGGPRPASEHGTRPPAALRRPRGVGDPRDEHAGLPAVPDHLRPALPRHRRLRGRARLGPDRRRRRQRRRRAGCSTGSVPRGRSCRWPRSIWSACS